MHDCSHLRVLDLSTGIAGGYCTKLFADARADVIKVEPVGGDPLRRWSVGGGELVGDGALFRFLHHGKRSVVGAAEDASVVDLLAAADVVVASAEDSSARERAEAWCASHPGLVVASITPFGLTGPYSGRPATHFTIEAEAGSLAIRGRTEMRPFQAGGRIAEWVAGTYAAVAALAYARRSRTAGVGELVDLSIHETMTISGGLFLDMMSSLTGRPDWPRPPRSLETPSIEPTADGWVGFNTNTRQQWEDFCVLIGRPDVLADDELATAGGRMKRWDEWNEIVRAGTTTRTTEDLLAEAGLLRVPAAPLGTGATVSSFPHFVDREVFVDSVDGSFRQPRPPLLVDGVAIGLPGPAPGLGEHDGACFAKRVRTRGEPHGSTAVRPLEGLSVVDLTNWWAGPAGTHMLAILGANVIKIESTRRPDGMRFAGVAGPGTENWWDYGFMFLSANSNKRGVTLDLSDARGKALAERLIRNADVVMENYAPRVVESFGLDWDRVHELNPAAVMVRMPAFGLSGPWRDRVGFAQTMEQMTGMAWVTGHVDDQPRIPRGPCDPNAGMHAVFALLVALEERDETGQGVLIESPMIEGALNSAAEQVIEFSAYGNLIERMGNRSPECAPQGLYECSGDGEALLAISVGGDAQWDALREVLGDPVWARDPELATRAGRHAAHDRIDVELARWAGNRSVTDAVDALVAAGVPAAGLTDTRETALHPHLVARGFYEDLSHPVVGVHPHPTAPFRVGSVERWLDRPAPMLGEHNTEILGGLGLSDAQLDDLAAEGVIGTAPAG